MDAICQRLKIAAAMLVVVSSFGWANFCSGQAIGARQYSVSTPNFRVYATDPQFAQQVAESAELNRKQLAEHWLGTELPPWSKPCPLVVVDGPNRLASGETKYTLVQGAVINFHMTVVGTRERILDSVLPHEITHTIVASHFAPMGKPVPRWADEGMCTTVEHEAERKKHDEMLVKFLTEGKGIPFASLFLMRDYPAEMLPLYAQGYSVTSFLIAQGGPRKFIQFLEVGMEQDDWAKATQQVYGYPMVGNLKTAWNQWVADGGGDVASYTAQSLGYSRGSLVAASSSPVTPAVATRDNRDLQTSDVQSAAAWLSTNDPRNAIRTASNTHSLNNSMHPSATGPGSYYLERLRVEQQKQQESIGNSSPIANNSMQSNPISSNNSPSNTTNPQKGIPYSVSQPAPLQTLGGGTIRR